MIYILFKIVDRKAHLITVDTTSGMVHSDLVPGQFFKKVHSSGDLVEIERKIIADRFHDSAEMMHGISRARYLAFTGINNLELIIRQQQIKMAPEK